MTVAERIFDCHAHLISDDQVHYPPSPVSGEAQPALLENPMTAERLIHEMDAANVARAVLVQRGQLYGFDNGYVCDSARKYPDRFVAVASVDGRDPVCAERVRYWTRERGAAGVRMMEPARGAPLTWFSGESAAGIWRAAAELTIPVCVHFFRWNRAAGLAVLGEIMDRYSGVTVVVDHVSNIAAEQGPPDFGVDDALRALADRPRAYTKFTTIPLGMLHDEGIEAAPFVRRIVDLFGAERVMWGSDITQSKGDYNSLVALAHEATRALSGDERRQVLWQCCNSVYGRNEL